MSINESFICDKITKYWKLSVQFRNVTFVGVIPIFELERVLKQFESKRSVSVLLCIQIKQLFPLT